VGDCHYRASCLEEELEAAVRFWDWDEYEDVTAEEGLDGVIIVRWRYSNKVPNISLRGTIGEAQWHHDGIGRGEWVASTMDDAKQMAMDYREGVS
jgi:hypothetical protein